MLERLFRFLMKKLPFSMAADFSGMAWVYCSVIFGLILILTKNHFEITGTRNIFLLSFLTGVFIATLISSISSGLFRIFGKTIGENRYLKTLNDNIIQGKVSSQISNDALLDTYYALDKIIVFLTRLTLVLASAVVLGSALTEYLYAKSFINTPIILGGGFIAMLVTLVFNTNFASDIMVPFRKQCKALLFARNISFEERPSTNLKTKLNLFILLLIFILLTIFLLDTPIKLSVFLISSIGLILIIFIVNSVFTPFQQALKEIEEAAQRLERGESTVFFSGSKDEEIISLSKSLNTTAQNIKNYREELKEAKEALEIKVRARTRELEELARGLDEKVQERTKELQKRIDELEKFYKLTIGRELRMAELKKEIKELKGKLQNK